MLPLTLLLYDLFFIQGISAVFREESPEMGCPADSLRVVLGWIYTDFSMQRAAYESGVKPFRLWSGS